jgi:hypothetical protein
VFHELPQNTSSYYQTFKEPRYTKGVYVGEIDPLPYRDVSLIPNSQLDAWLAEYLNASHKTWFTRSRDEIAVLENIIAVMGLRSQYALCLRSLVAVDDGIAADDGVFHSKPIREEDRGLALWYALSTATPRQRAEALYLTLTEYG